MIYQTIFFHCLLTARAKVQSVDRKASFLLLGDVNPLHDKWLGPSTKNLHGRTARDFASSSACEQMFMEPTHIDGEMFDFVLTDVPGIEGVRVDSPSWNLRLLYNFYRC